MGSNLLKIVGKIFRKLQSNLILDRQRWYFMGFVKAEKIYINYLRVLCYFNIDTCRASAYFT